MPYTYTFTHVGHAPYTHTHTHTHPSTPPTHTPPHTHTPTHAYLHTYPTCLPAPQVHMWRMVSSAVDETMDPTSKRAIKFIRLFSIVSGLVVVAAGGLVWPFDGWRFGAACALLLRCRDYGVVVEGGWGAAAAGACGWDWL